MGGTGLATAGLGDLTIGETDGEVLMGLRFGEGSTSSTAVVSSSILTSWGLGARGGGGVEVGTLTPCSVGGDGVMLLGYDESSPSSTLVCFALLFLPFFFFGLGGDLPKPQESLGSGCAGATGGWRSKLSKVGSKSSEEGIQPACEMLRVRVGRLADRLMDLSSPTGGGSGLLACFRAVR